MNRPQGPFFKHHFLAPSGCCDNVMNIRDDGGVADQTPTEGLEYVFEPLSTDEHVIRLVEVLSGYSTDPVSVSIRHVPLAKAECSYDAISYMWGPADKTYRVWVDGHYIVVRENIYRFLKHYRNNCIEGTALLLWIDTLCINQQDLIEKGRQVGRMGSVFSSAHQVLIWLGEISENKTEHVTDRDIEFAYGEVGLHRADIFFENKQRSHENKASARRLHACASAVASHTYWLRLWIVQEVTLARNHAKVIHGSHLFQAEVLKSMRNLSIVGLESDKRAAREIFEALIPDVDTDIAWTNGRDLGGMLELFALQQCQDPKDRIYGLLGLLDPASPASKITVDYEISTWALFLQVFDILLEESKKPDNGPEQNSAWYVFKRAADVLHFFPNDTRVSLTRDTLITFRPQSKEFRDYFIKYPDASKRSVSHVMDLCELTLPVSMKDEQWEITRKTCPKTSRPYDLLTKQSTDSQRDEPTENSRWRTSGFRQLWKSEEQYRICCVDGQLDLLLRRSGKGKLRLIGHAHGRVPYRYRFELTKLPTGIEKLIQDKLDRSGVTDRAIRSGARDRKLPLDSEKMQISFSIEELLRLLVVTRKHDFSAIESAILRGFPG